MPTFDQIRAPLERVLYIALGYIAAKGWIGKEMVGDIITVVLALAAAGYGIYTTKQSVVAARAADALPAGSVIVTSSEIAAATPNNPNVVSKADVKVVEK